MIQNLNSVSYTTSDQHKEASCSRKNVILRIHEKSQILKERSRSENTESLGNIAAGVTAGPKVNVDRAEIIGKDIVATMVDQNVLNFLFNVRINPPT